MHPISCTQAEQKFCGCLWLAAAFNNLANNPENVMLCIYGFGDLQSSKPLKNGQNIHWLHVLHKKRKEKEKKKKRKRKEKGAF